MAAQPGNKQAEKWTKEIVLEMLANIKKEAKKPECLYLGTVLASNDLYKDIWVYWKEKFEGDEDVFRTMKTIDQIFESKLFTGSLKGEFNPATAIFGLKNNHEWKDKSNIDHTTGGDKLPSPGGIKLIDPTKLSTEALREIYSTSVKDSNRPNN